MYAILCCSPEMKYHFWFITIVGINNEKGILGTILLHFVCILSTLRFFCRCKHLTATTALVRGRGCVAASRPSSLS